MYRRTAPRDGSLHQVGAAHPRARPLAVLVTDTAVMIGRLRVSPPTDVTLAPDGASGPYCLYLVAPFRAEWDGWQRLAVRRGLGPCAFRAVYGAPGPAIDRWLAARGYDLAGTTLLSAAGGHVPPPRPGDVRRNPLLRLIGADFEGEGFSLAGWACVRGNAARCADAVLLAIRRQVR